MFPSFYDFESAAVFLAAAAAVYRGGQYGHHFTGCMLLGGLSGFSGITLCNILLNIPASVFFKQQALFVLSGCLLGAISIRCNKWNWPIFRWSDTWALAFTSIVGCAKAVICGVDSVSAMLIGVAAGTVPGLIRDFALGDTATAIEETCYVTAVVWGIIVYLICVRFAYLPEFLIYSIPIALIGIVRFIGYWQTQK